MFGSLAPLVIVVVLKHIDFSAGRKDANVDM